MLKNFSKNRLIFSFVLSFFSVFWLFSTAAVSVSLPAQSITLFVVGSGMTPTAFAAPSNLVGTKTANTIKLSWRDNSADEDGFVIERANGTTGSFAEVFRTGAN